MKVRTSCLYVDGPNIDQSVATILGRKPLDWQRPRWDRVKNHFPYLTQKPQFPLIGPLKDFQFKFRRSMIHMGFHVPVLCVTAVTPDNDDATDCYILEELHRLLARGLGDELEVTVVGHDHFCVYVLAEILRDGSSVNLVGFREEFASALLDLENMGAQIFDLEHDIGAFTYRLPRPVLAYYSR